MAEDIPFAPVAVIRDKLIEIGRGALETLPQLMIALVFLLLTWIATFVARFLISRLLSRTALRRELVDLSVKMVSIAIWATGLLIAATIVFPSLTPAKLLTAFGLGSIAIGLAFRDIFENFIAGILILLREPMRLGDYIECNDVDGSVERITIRDTYLRRNDGQLVLVPNAKLLKNPVYIKTDLPKRRMSIICGIAYGEDVDVARDVIAQALQSLDCVDAESPVQVFAKAFGSSSIDFEVCWWSGSKPIDERRSRDMVIAAVKRALDRAGIEIPFPYRTIVLRRDKDDPGLTLSADTQD